MLIPPPTSTKQIDPRSDAQRVTEEKRRKEKDIELLAFNSTEDVEAAEDAQVSHFIQYFLTRMGYSIFPRRMIH